MVSLHDHFVRQLLVDADTKRLAVVKDMIPMDPKAMAALVRETVRQALQDNLGPALGAFMAQVTQPVADEDVPSDVPAGLPIRVPNVGQQAAEPGGQAP